MTDPLARLRAAVETFDAGTDYDAGATELRFAALELLERTTVDPALEVDPGPEAHGERDARYVLVHPSDIARAGRVRGQLPAGASSVGIGAVLGADWTRSLAWHADRLEEGARAYEGVRRSAEADRRELDALKADRYAVRRFLGLPLEGVDVVLADRRLETAGD